MAHCHSILFFHIIQNRHNIEPGSHTQPFPVGMGRIELPSHAPEACILPLYYIPKILV